MPPGLKLVQAHWFIRHGERTPDANVLGEKGIADVPAAYELCQTGEAFTNAVASVSASAKSTLHDQARDALCAPGQLTDVGRTSATRLGASLREVYTKHGLLSGGAEDLHHIRLRSTKMARTLETCHNVATGLFPSRAKDLEILVRRPLDEDLYANKYCKLVKEMDLSARSKAAELFNPSLKRYDDVLRKHFPTPLRLDSQLRAVLVMDTITVLDAHGISLAEEFRDPKLLRTFEEAIVAEWFGAYYSSLFRKLAMGRLLRSVRLDMDVEKPTPRLAINTAHDTTIAGLLASLRVFDRRWPPFLSTLAFELFERPDSPQERYVRLQYNSKAVKLPECEPAGKHFEGSNGAVCTFAAFKEALAKVELSPEEWDSMCGASIRDKARRMEDAAASLPGAS